MVEYKTGYFAESLCGHDKGRLYMIVSEDRDRVGLCDGERRLLVNPKCKKKKHAQMIRSERTAADYDKLPDESGKDRWIRERVHELRMKRKENGR